MKTTKRRMEFFSFYNHTGIAAHLAKMAKKGWMIESITNAYWTYRKIEPKDIHFSVSYYPRASDFDPEPTEEQQEFNDFCACTGWKYICSWFQMQVFCNERANPLPLDTDPITEVDTLHRACKKNFLIGYYFLLVVGLIASAYSLAGIYFVPIDYLSSSNRMMILLAWLSLFAIALVEVVTYWTWHNKAKKAAQDGIFVDTPNTGGFQKGVIVILLIGVVWWFANLFAAGDSLMLTIAVANLFITFGVIFLVNFIKQALKKAKASRGMNKFLTFTACFILPVIFTVALVYCGITSVENGWISSGPSGEDSAPLSLQDFIEINEDRYMEDNRIEQTFLLGKQEYHHRMHWDLEGSSTAPDLKYTIVTVKAPFLYDWCKRQMYRDQDETHTDEWPVGNRRVYMEQDSAPWKAQEVYRIYSEEGWWENLYLLCYDDKIIEIRFDWEPTAEDMALVASKLNP